MSLLDIWACICNRKILRRRVGKISNQTYLSKIFYAQDLHQFWDDQEGIWYEKIKIAYIFYIMIKNIVIKIIIYQISHISNFYTNNDTKTEKNNMRTTSAPSMNQI